MSTATVALHRGAPRRFVDPRTMTPEQYVAAYGPARRLDRLVLLDIARHADYDDRGGPRPKVWGAGAVPSVPHVAERVGYCVRSVQYALRRLVADGYLEIEERPGRTHHSKIVRRVLAIVEDEPDRGATVAPGGAKVAPDLGTPTKDLPPYPPSAVAEIDDDRAAARTASSAVLAHRGCAKHQRPRAGCRRCAPTPVPDRYVPAPVPRVTPPPAWSEVRQALTRRADKGAGDGGGAAGRAAEPPGRSPGMATKAPSATHSDERPDPGVIPPANPDPPATGRYTRA